MSKEHAYAYEAGYRDGSIHYELEHCPACKNVADLQEALDENTRLKELCASLYEFDDKLRELCARLYEFAMSENPDSAELNFADSLRKLGMVVDA